MKFIKLAENNRVHFINVNQVMQISIDDNSLGILYVSGKENNISKIPKQDCEALKEAIDNFIADADHLILTINLNSPNLFNASI